MTIKMPKPALGLLIFTLAITFTVLACNNKKGGDKETKDDTATMKPADPAPIDTSNMDTASTRPVKTPD